MKYDECSAHDLNVKLQREIHVERSIILDEYNHMCEARHIHHTPYMTRIKWQNQLFKVSNSPSYSEES